MATKKAKAENINETVAEKSAAIIEKYTESPIKGVDNTSVNSALSALTLEKPEIEEEVIDGKESETHFINGIVPAGFSNTYGQEIDSSVTGQASELLAAAHKVFKKEDNFRFFLKYLDNFIFSVVVPIRFSNQDDLSYAYYKVDVRSCVLKPGKVTEQVEMFCNKVARHLNYQKRNHNQH